MGYTKKNKIRKPKTWLEVTKHPNVEQAWVEYEPYGDGKPNYWVILKEGWVISDNPQRSIHENSVKAVIIEMARIVKGESEE